VFDLVEEEEVEDISHLGGPVEEEPEEVLLKEFTHNEGPLL